LSCRDSWVYSPHRPFGDATGTVVGMVTGWPRSGLMVGLLL
jgi:hypothetical protein